MRKIQIITSIAVVLCLFLLCVPTAWAASFSDGADGTVELAVSANNTKGSYDTTNGVLTGRIYGTTRLALFHSAQNYTITITNNNAYEVKLDGMLSVSCSGGDGKYNINSTGGVKVSDGSTAAVDMGAKSIKLGANGGKMTIYVASPGGSTAFTDISWAIKAIPYIEYSVTFTTADHGSYTVGGAAITGETTMGIVGAEGVDLAVTPDSGYTCLGFANASSNKLVVSLAADKDANGAQTVHYSPAANGVKLVPVFVPTPSDTPFSVGSKNYYTWESAMVAGRGSVVVLNKTYELPTTLAANYLTTAGNYVTGTDGNLSYTIPGGTTLLVPFDPDATLADTLTTASFGMSEYRRLTIPSDTHVTVDGTLLVQSAQGRHSTRSMGNPAGAYGCVEMKKGSTMTVNGTLKVRGLLIGEENAADVKTGTAPITVNSGATVVQLLQVCDFRGGSKATTWASKGAFIINQLYIQNIQVGIRYNAGCYLLGQYYISAGETDATGTMNMIGTTADSMFVLKSGYMMMTYIPDDAITENDDAVTVVDIVGNTDMSRVSVTFTYIINYTISTEKSQLPLFGGWNVNIRSGSTVNVKYDAKLLPGAVVLVEEGANLNIKSKVYLYDVRDYVQTTTDSIGCFCYSDYRYYPNTYRKPTAEKHVGYNAVMPDTEVDGSLIVNGTLTISEGGALYTSPTSNQVKTFAEDAAYVGYPLYSTSNTGKIVVESTAAATKGLAELDQPKDVVRTLTFIAAQGQVLDTTDNKSLTMGNIGGTAGTYYHYVGHGWSTKKHEVTHYEEVASTCQTKGHSAYDDCKCGYTSKNEFPLAEHAPSGEATCTTAQTCTVCKATLAPALGTVHAWAEGTESVGHCDNCSAVFDFAANVAVEEALDMYFYIDVSDVAGIANPENLLIEVTKASYDTTGHSGTVTKMKAEWDDSVSGMYRVCFPEIAAKEMMDELTAVVYQKNGDSLTQLSVTHVDSIADYAHRIYQGRKDDLTDKNMALFNAFADMLNYGAYCQKLFGYNADNLANRTDVNTGEVNDWNDGLMDYATKSDLDTADDRTKGTYSYGTSFTAEHKLQYSFYYNFNGAFTDPTQLKPVITITQITKNDDGTTTETVLDLEPTLQWYTRSVNGVQLHAVDIIGIPIYCGDATIKCELYNGEIKAENLVDTTTDNLANYADRVNDAGQTLLYNTSQSLMKFTASARTYFNTK